MRKFLPKQKSPHNPEPFPKGFEAEGGLEKTKAYVAAFCRNKNHIPAIYTSHGKAYAA